ncbi:polysaccharide lyase family 1 protein [Actinoplanes sp. NPDC051513]|uniref:polysaccharide lyase family 1 protein n=1 Tax=Actinoplanes sp. NPDC051513 TaxID=3363908 RepID=UPI0037969B20
MPSRATSAAVLAAVAALGIAGPPLATPAGAAPPAGALAAPAGVTAETAAVGATAETAAVGATAETTPAGATTQAAAGATTQAVKKSGLSPAALKLGRQTLPANDGWASSGAGTTGGAAADDAHVAVVRTRAELIAALGGNAATNGQNATPKIVYVSGKIDLRVDADNNAVGCDSFADPDYSLDAFLAAYDPAVWGTAAKPSGPLEDARVRSAKKQGDTIKVNVGSNTTIVGINGGRLTHGSLVVTNVSNVIVRNLELTDAADCFPAWDPTDGATGNWNSLYDLVSLSGATNVWIDHNTFSDGNNHDEDQPLYFGRPYQAHDGASDIIRGSDLVTVSWNDYYDHDKTMLIGSTDTPGVDVGKLRVTVHHNRFGNVIQRAPRVRFGQVDVYDNLYVATDELYQYSLGVGVESSIYAENNYFKLSADVPAADVIHYWKGTKITAIGSLVQVGNKAKPVDLVAAYNAAYDPNLTPDAGWTPALRTRLDPAWAVPLVVAAGVGIRHLGC